MSKPNQSDSNAAGVAVTILVPVRNGGSGLDRALRSVSSQTFRDLVIVVSDNHSEDSTSEIIDHWVEKDDRVRRVRPPELLPAMDHFLWLLAHAKSEFVCFVAHDDERSTSFVELLVDALERTPSACLAFGDVTLEDAGGRRSGFDFAFETTGEKALSRIRKTVLLQCFHLYGLWRRDVLESIPRVFSDWWMDTPIMTSAAARGEFVYASGAEFIYHNAGGFSKGKAGYHLLKKRRASYPVRLAGLLRATFENLRHTDGTGLAFWACLCVLEKQFRGIPRWVRMRVARD